MRVWAVIGEYKYDSIGGNGTHIEIFANHEAAQKRRDALVEISNKAVSSADDLADYMFYIRWLEVQ